MSKDLAINRWQDDIPPDIRNLIRVIAHEWLKDIPPTIDNTRRVCDFLQETLVGFDRMRAAILANYEREWIERLSLTIAPPFLARLPVRPADTDYACNNARCQLIGSHVAECSTEHRKQMEAKP